MSNIDKQALRERYSAKPTPKCHICGTEMTVQRMSGSRVTYGCSGAIYDENGCHYADGRSLADDHYEQSRVTVTDESDPDVLALLDELEAKDQRIAELSALQGKPIAWESTTPVYVKFITDERYQRLRPGYKKWYKPYRCSQCAAAAKGKAS
ncbi:TPA: ead/Ea22-like family protein [Enterobacter asburiae]|nr:ead/Ea22-like family protein [Enterobacter asburiae]